jgi:hypothetical protein
MVYLHLYRSSAIWVPQTCYCILRYCNALLQLEQRKIHRVQITLVAVLATLYFADYLVRKSIKIFTNGQWATITQPEVTMPCH